MNEWWKTREEGRKGGRDVRLGCEGVRVSKRRKGKIEGERGNDGGEEGQS